ncbi:MAG TPA: hypothetical protein VK195_05730, partial [Burkholderiaceae bacterium]|nr:hypothetical protein [Burkholderiaceae bacterium]
MASPLVTHAPDRPHARGAAHASTGSRAASASSAVTRPGVMDSTRMVAQRQRMAAMSGPVGTAGGGAIQRMPNPPSGGQTPGHPTPPASSQGSSS